MNTLIKNLITSIKLLPVLVLVIILFINSGNTGIQSNIGYFPNPILESGPDCYKAEASVRVIICLSSDC